MPSNKFMKDKCNVSTNTDYSMFLEQISPGTGGRHRRTFTIIKKQEVNYDNIFKIIKMI